MTVVTACAILRAIRAADASVPVTVQQTGGGCATVYVGAYDAARERFTLAIGPGSFDWGNSTLSTFALGDTCIGPDDDGTATPVYVARLSDITAYVAAMRCNCGGPSDGSECRHPRGDDA